MLIKAVKLWYNEIKEAKRSEKRWFLFMLELQLQKLGLTDKEASVYIATLEFGFAPVQNIAEKANVNRTTAYVAIEGLIQKGLISQFEKDHKRYFAAENPDNIERILKVKEQQLMQDQQSVSNLLPELKALFNFGSLKPKVRYYEGVEGVKNTLQLLLDGPGRLLKGFTNLDNVYKHFPDHDKDYVKRRIENSIRTKVLYTRKAGLIKNASNPSLLRQALFVPLDKYPLGADLTIAVDKVVIVSFYKDPIIGIIIEDRGLATTLDTLFELSWATALKHNSNR